MPDLTEIDAMLTTAAYWADHAEGYANERVGHDAQVAASVSRAWSALASTHLQRLGLLYSVENMAKIDAERERIVSQIEATA